METKELTLVVKEKTIGSLVTNAIEIQNFVKARIQDYNPDNYTGTAEQAKKDRAELNKAAEKLNSERLALEKEFNKPFEEFKAIVNDTCKLIKDASLKIDAVVKAADDKAKEEKKAQIEAYWKDCNFDLVSLEKIFNPKWYNKTFKILDIQEEINDRITQIKNDLSAIEDFGTDVDTLKPLYLSTLNLQATLSKGAELKANREKLAAVEIVKEEFKADEVIVENPKAETPVDMAKVSEAVKPVIQSMNPTQNASSKKMEFEIIAPSDQLECLADTCKEFGLEVKVAIKLSGTPDQLKALKVFFDENETEYNKVIKEKVLTLEMK